MKMNTKKISSLTLIAFYLFSPFVLPQSIQAQNYSNYNNSGSYSQRNLEILVAPIALYPDPLIAQILPASTYPLEIVQAARIIRSKKDFKKIDYQDWDPSVKAVARYPSVLKMMNEKLQWTEDLGEAVLSQQGNVLQAIQTLRYQAKQAGNLRSNKKQIIYEENNYIEVLPYDTEVVYIPSYDPQVVYVDQGYDAFSSVISFGIGFALGSWFNTEPSWHNRRIHYSNNPYWWNKGRDRDRSNNRYRDRDRYQNNDYNRSRNNNSNNNTNVWTHDNNRTPVKRSPNFMQPIAPNSQSPKGSVLIPRAPQSNTDRFNNGKRNNNDPKSGGSRNPDNSSWRNNPSAAPIKYQNTPPQRSNHNNTPPAATPLKTPRSPAPLAPSAPVKDSPKPEKQPEAQTIKTPPPAPAPSVKMKYE